MLSKKIVIFCTILTLTDTNTFFAMDMDLDHARTDDDCPIDLAHLSLRERTDDEYAMNIAQLGLREITAEKYAWHMRRLTNAVLFSDREQIEYELRQPGINVNGSDYEDDTALSLAAARDRKIAMRCLLKHGANPNQKNPRTGNVPLFEIYHLDQVPLIQMLVEFGANIEVTDNKGMNLLMRIAGCNWCNPRALCSSAHYLLANTGINVNHQDRLGKTALTYATKTENWKMVELLIQFGADTTIIDYENL